MPWLAQNYTVSADGTTVNITLRGGITFGDGQELNSTDVYFSYNRLLITDGATPSSVATQASWIMQQLVNRSLSWVFGGPHNYTQTWAQEVLAQNFVQVTGPLTLTLHIQNPSAALPYLLAGQWADIMEPDYVIRNDLSQWLNPSSGYTLPYPNPSGNATQLIDEYLQDQVATCDSGITPKGCGMTYLDGSYNGSLAGTGPYILKSVGESTSDISLVANPNYWGSPFQFLNGSQKLSPQIKSIAVNFVPSETTRELDLQNAASSGRAMMVDITSDHLYDVANRTDWLSSNILSSIVPGTTIYGPFTNFAADYDPFETNVSNPSTGTFYTFQPFADVRFRLAFADAVNVTEINIDVNNKLGVVANGAVQPGLPPVGAYNASITPRYSYNLTAVQDLLLAAMETPLTHFTFENGTAAPQGMFNNTFGCTAAELTTNGGTCAKPVPQSIALYYSSGDSVNEAIMQDIASAVNNVSSTYNMGLTISTIPEPIGEMYTQAFSGQIYMYPLLDVTADYPWSPDQLGGAYAPNNIFTAPDGWNLTIMANLYNQALVATANNNVSGVVTVSNLMTQVANQEVMYLWTFYPLGFNVITSNVHGIYFNPSWDVVPGSLYFATLTVS